MNAHEARLRRANELELEAQALLRQLILLGDLANDLVDARERGAYVADAIAQQTLDRMTLIPDNDRTRGIRTFIRETARGMLQG